MKTFLFILSFLGSLNSFALTQDECRPESFSEKTKPFLAKVDETEKVKNVAVNFLSSLKNATKKSTKDLFGKTYMVSAYKNYDETSQSSGEECSWYKTTRLIDYCSYNPQDKRNSIKCAQFCQFRIQWEDCR